MTDQDRPYTPDRLAERWDCSPATVRNLCRRGELAHFKVGKEYRIPQPIVDEVEACRSATSEPKSTSPDASATPARAPKIIMLSR
jgi:excisionase family DNA binding protein